MNVMDRGQPPRSIEHRIIVNVSDVNDCVPEFDATSSRFTRIDEELPNGQCRLCVNVSLYNYDNYRNICSKFYSY